MTLHKITLPLLGFCMFFFAGCTAKVHTFEMQLLAEADSLFRVGNFEYSKVKYAKIKEIGPNSTAARTAQYNLGFINVYYDNPFANWEAALREFKTFASLYPDDFRIQQVNSWIRILVVMQAFKKDFQGTSQELNEANKRRIADSRLFSAQSKMSIDSINEALKNCSDGRDSLSRKTRELENVILDLERKCQQAGR